MLENITTSKTRQLVLELFFHHPNTSFFLRDVARRIKRELNSVKRELDLLVESKILQHEKRLNKVFYVVNKNHDIYTDLLRIATRSTKLAKSIKEHMHKLGSFEFVALSTKYLTHEINGGGEIYLIFVGQAVQKEIEDLVLASQSEFDKEIYYTTLSRDEFAFRKRNNDPFVIKFLRTQFITLKGDYDAIYK